MEAELVLLRGSGQSAQAIIGNSILGAPCTLTTVMSADLSGADLVTVAHTVAGVQSKLLVRPEIKKPEDLRGKRIAVSGFGSLGDFLERYILKKYGIDPVRDVVMLSIGNQPDRIQALFTGARRCRRPVSSRRYPSRAQRISHSLGRQTGSCLSFHVDRHQA